MASIVKVDKIAQASGTPEFTIPTADGTAGQFIKTDASGVLSFGSAAALTGSTNTWIPTITAANALTGTANFTYDGNTLDVKNSGTASDVKVYCETANTHYTSIKSAAHAAYTGGSWTMTLPGTDGAANEFLQTNGSGVTSWATAGGGMQSTQVFTASGTWTKPAGITKVLVKIVGAGGGGGCGTGAGAGGYSEKIIDVSSISTSTVTIGAGGVGNNGQTPGGNVGGVSSWVDGTNTLSCGGGLAPTYVSTGYKGGLGGVATGGDINIAGGDSDPHMDSSYIEQLGSTGGASYFGGGGAGGASQSGLNEGSAARAYGAGGGGAQSSGVWTGGNGAPGVCIVYEFK